MTMKGALLGYIFQTAALLGVIVLVLIVSHQSNSGLAESNYQACVIQQRGLAALPYLRRVLYVIETSSDDQIETQAVNRYLAITAKQPKTRKC